MFKFFDKMPNELLVYISGFLAKKDQLSLSNTCKRWNAIMKTELLGLNQYKLNIINQRLLTTIQEFNKTIYYSYESKRSTIISRNTFYIKHNDREINKLFSNIESLLSQGADPNSAQFLHEAMLLYSVYKFYMQNNNSLRYQYHDSRQTLNMLRLVKLLLKHGADRNVPYNGDPEYLELASLKHPGTGGRNTQHINTENMHGLSAIEYATKLQKTCPKILKLFDELKNNNVKARIR